MRYSPAFSIITINLNNDNGLEKTIESVINQSFIDIQYIIIDGGSTDNSCKIIDHYKTKIHYFISEKDSGIYNAMNKGIEIASGKYCLFLNSGDYFINNDVLQNFINGNYSADILCGGALVYEKGKNVTVIAPENISFYTFYKHTIIHQATFIKLDLLKKLGLYNERLKILADWEFFVRAFAFYKASYQSLPFIISRVDTSGISSNPQNAAVCKKERGQVFNEYFKFFIPDYELLNDSANYKFLLNIRKHRQIHAVFNFCFRIINRMLR